MSIDLNSLVKNPLSTAQATRELNELKGAGKASGGLNQNGKEVEAALEALIQGDGGSSSGAADPGRCPGEKTNPSAIDAGTSGSATHFRKGEIPNPEGISPGARNGVTVIGEGQVPNPGAVSANTAPAVATLAVAPTSADDSSWSAASSAV